MGERGGIIIAAYLGIVFFLWLLDILRPLTALSRPLCIFLPLQSPVSGLTDLFFCLFLPGYFPVVDIYSISDIVSALSVLVLSDLSLLH